MPQDKTNLKTKARPAPKNPVQPLVAGQVWRMAEMELRVGQVGNLFVNYKLAKPDAARVANSVSSKENVQKYLKKNKAVLVKR
jgi:hypothetical protein